MCYPFHLVIPTKVGIHSFWSHYRMMAPRFREDVISNVRTIRLTLEYEGTNYSGFQRQKNGVAIQNLLEKALETICGKPVAVIGAGRTDAGVHALEQVCHFKTISRLSTETLRKALNRLLPRDIVIHQVDEMPADFHARYTATARTYAYFLLNRPVPSALFGRFLVWAPYEIDVEAMNEACRFLVGEKNFSSFCNQGSSRKNHITHVKKALCVRGTKQIKLPFSYLGGDLVMFYIKADSFLYSMVRIAMGTLLQIGRKKKSPHDMEKILKEQDRKTAGPTAPAKGLFLIKADYPKKYQ